MAHRRIINFYVASSRFDLQLDQSRLSSTIAPQAVTAIIINLIITRWAVSDNKRYERWSLTSHVTADPRIFHGWVRNLLPLTRACLSSLYPSRNPPFQLTLTNGCMLWFQLLASDDAKAVLFSALYSWKYSVSAMHPDTVQLYEVGNYTRVPPSAAPLTTFQGRSAPPYRAAFVARA